MNNDTNIDNDLKNDISLRWYFHPNEIVRLLRAKIYENIDINIDLSPNYTNDLKIGVVIGTYGSVAYVNLALHYLKNVNKIDKILVHDDCSPKKDELKKLCEEYNVDFYSTESNMFYKTSIGSIGDQNCFFEGLKWAKENKLDILVKFSRRLIPCFEWVSDFKDLVLKSDGLTFSSYCKQDNFPIRTECIAMNVNAWTNEFVMKILNFYIKNNICVFAEFFNDEMAKQIDFQNFSEKYKNYKKENFTGYTYSGYVHWYDILGKNRYTKDDRNENVLWHMYSTPEDYLNKSNEIFKDKYKLDDFKNI